MADKKRKGKRSRRRRGPSRELVLGVLLCIVFIAFLVLWRKGWILGQRASKAAEEAAAASESGVTSTESIALAESSGDEPGTLSGAETSSGEEAFPDTQEEEAEEEEVYESISMVTDQAPYSFAPYSTAVTNPGNMIEYIKASVNNVEIEDFSSFVPGHFGLGFDVGSSYTGLEGILTFRGNNFRNNPTYGYANMKDYKFNTVYAKPLSYMTIAGRNWTGCGWTGQPLIVKWPRATKSIMNMYEWAKQDDNVTEVIYACMDGCIYFFDLNTGAPTRDVMDVGYVFKGTGALDPRGYPVLYVGSGYPNKAGVSRGLIISLIDGTILYKIGFNDPYSPRVGVNDFDASPLVDAETDTLIWPGENGILYLTHLNSGYDEVNGVVSIAPDYMIKWTSKGFRTDTDGKYWLGMEDSPCIYQGYLFVADNGGHLMCVDLNSLQIIWVQDVLDDTNSSPVLSVEDGRAYLYIGTSFHPGWRSDHIAATPVFKIDAENGEIVWQANYESYTERGIPGGIQSTIATGANQLSDYIYVTVARTGSEEGGVLACLRKSTGEVVWQHNAAYTCSSPVCVYSRDGRGTVVYATSEGMLYLIDGVGGMELDAIPLTKGGSIEASPAVYNDMLVIGTREQAIFGIELT